MEILDSFATRETYKPINYKTTGLLIGVIAIIIVTLALYSNENQWLAVLLPYRLPIFVFMMITEIVIAMFGHRKKHFWGIYWGGLITAVLGIIPATIYFYWANGNNLPLILRHCVSLFAISALFGLFTSILFWFFPGKLSYFRNYNSKI